MSTTRLVILTILEISLDTTFGTRSKSCGGRVYESCWAAPGGKARTSDIIKLAFYSRPCFPPPPETVMN